MNIHKLLTFAALASTAILADAELVARFPMEVSGGEITEQVSGATFAVQGIFEPENLPGAVGEALRFDGYTSRVDAAIPTLITEGNQLTVSLWVAVPCYPIIQIDTNTSEQTAIVTCLDENKKAGFGFYLGFDGKYSFRSYSGGWALTLNVDTPLPTYTWNHLVAVLDADSRTATLYNNGEQVATGKCNGTIDVPASKFYMGMSTASRKAGPFELMAFNGLIDDVCIYNTALPTADFAKDEPQNGANLDIPESRFADQLLRPKFHGMPAAAWTNECHGMTFSDGRYHLFFQKNADGPYMARLHWGHISSENLYDWREEKIAIAPGDWYDIKGCWSGCVFTDAELTGNKPNIIYTGVDYAKAMICQAAPLTDELDNWVKASDNPIINGRPGGLSDDFRDPYFFRSGNYAYIIVGSSKDGVGTTTLHRLNTKTGAWSNDGSLFFTGKSAAEAGKFWEMPTITPMGDDRWLFTATPLGTSQGVRTLYWTGKLDYYGKFVADANFASPKLVEMNSREGFGLLSPTIYQHDGKTIVLGIVPDKLPSADNYRLGWAHCYSLPREWSLDADGTLLQKPFSGLVGLRSSTSYERTDFTLNGAESLSPVDGRMAEILATFETGTTPFGINIFGNGAASASLTYNPVTGELIADFSKLERLVNDGGVYDGIYTCPVPDAPKNGAELKLNVFIDHSIVDIFVNDKWATSIRVFPTAADASAIEAFGTSVKVKSLQAWTLNGTGIQSGAEFPEVEECNNEKVDVISISGMKLRSNVCRSEATVGLPKGIYIVGNNKIAVR